MDERHRVVPLGTGGDGQIALVTSVQPLKGIEVIEYSAFEPGQRGAGLRVLVAIGLVGSVTRLAELTLKPGDRTRRVDEVLAHVAEALGGTMKQHPASGADRHQRYEQH
jgi:hypothetical protein